MSETAAGPQYIWVDHLLPAVPYRQWVLSSRSSVSVRMGSCGSTSPHSTASRAAGDLHPGLVTVVRRFRADAGVYAHLDLLVADGAWWQTLADARPRARPGVVDVHPHTRNSRYNSPSAASLGRSSRSC
jgi:hypothetical protein